VPDRIHLDTLPDTPIIFDACCLINLHAASALLAMLQTVGKPAIVATYVAERELRRLPLQTLFADGHLTQTDVTNEAEKMDWVTYALTYDLEDGEAITGAIARSRGWMIATDEGKAIKAFKETIPEVVIITTPDLVRHWADTTLPSPASLRQALDDIQVKGNYYPGKHHPLHRWWRAISPFRPAES
jgi:hypothetical protein